MTREQWDHLKETRADLTGYWNRHHSDLDYSFVIRMISQEEFIQQVCREILSGERMSFQDWLSGPVNNL